MNDVGRPVAHSDVRVGPLQERAGTSQFGLVDAGGKRLVNFLFTRAEEAERARAGLCEIAESATLSTHALAIQSQIGRAHV